MSAQNQTPSHLQKKINKSKSPRLSHIISLWKSFIPLSLTDMAMAIGEPVRNYAVASLPQATTNLAAVGVAKSLAVFFESPIIMILHASNALARNGKSSRNMLFFTLIFSSILSILFLGLSIPDIFNYLGTHIFSLSYDISNQTRVAVAALCLWPFIIGWRRYFQGVLIQNKKNRIVAFASIFRLLFVIGFPLMGMKLGWSGLVCAISSLISGIIAESIFVTIYSLNFGVLKETYQRTDASLPQSYKEITSYYFPLAFSMIVIWGTRAILVFLLSYAIDSEKALVIWPIAWGFVLVVSNGTRMIQQVYISERSSYPLKTFVYFSFSVAALFSLIIIGLTSTAYGVSLVETSMNNVSHLLKEVMNCLLFALAFPAFTTFQNFLQGEMISLSLTKSISKTSIISNILMTLCAYYFIVYEQLPGAYSMMISFNIGVIIEIFLYVYHLKKNQHSLFFS